MAAVSPIASQTSDSASGAEKAVPVVGYAVAVVPLAIKSTPCKAKLPQGSSQPRGKAPYAAFTADAKVRNALAVFAASFLVMGLELATS